MAVHEAALPQISTPTATSDQSSSLKEVETILASQEGVMSRINTTKISRNGKRRIFILNPSAFPIQRPIFHGNSALVPSDSLPNQRPILMGSRPVASHDHLPLHRPVFHSLLNIVEMRGNRPILHLDLPLVPSDFFPGRPTSTKPWPPEPNLMGFLD